MFNFVVLPTICNSQLTQFATTLLFAANVSVYYGSTSVYNAFLELGLQSKTDISIHMQGVDKVSPPL